MNDSTSSTVLIRLLSFLRSVLPVQGFARSVSILASGTISGQIVLILASPILTRLYSPEEFGLYAIYSALFLTGSVVLSLRYQLAIPVAKDHSDAVSLALISVVCLVAISALIAVLLIWKGAALSEFMNATQLEPFFLLLPVAFLFYGASQILVCWFLRQRRYSQLSLSRVAQPIVLVLAQIALAFAGFIGLVLGQIAGQAAALFSLVRNTGIQSILGQITVSLRNLTEVAIRYKRFPLFSTWGGLFNVAGQQFPAILFAVLFAPEVAGLYALAQRLLLMPMSLVGSAAAEVFFSGASEAIRNNTMANRVERMLYLMSQLALPAVLVLMLSGEEIFGLVFGEQWRISGQYATWLCPMLFVVFTTSPMSTLLTAMDRENEHALFQGVLFAVRLSAMWLGAVYGGALFAVICFSLSSTICWFVLQIRIFCLAGNTRGQMARLLLNTIVWSAFLVAPLFTAHLLGWDSSAWWMCFSMSFVMILVRYVVLLRKYWR